jgi:hypothetical protein
VDVGAHDGDVRQRRRSAQRGNAHLYVQRNKESNQCMVMQKKRQTDEINQPDRWWFARPGCKRPWLPVRRTSL